MVGGGGGGLGWHSQSLLQQTFVEIRLCAERWGDSQGPRETDPSGSYTTIPIITN